MKILAALETFDELIAVMRDRRISLGLSQNALEDRAGLTGGYVGKLEASRGKSNSRSIGRESLPLLLGALGLELAVVDGSMRAVAAHAAQDEAGQSVAVLRGQKYMQALGKLGARKTNARLTGKERTANARKAAKARWKRYRDEKNRSTAIKRINQAETAE